MGKPFYLSARQGIKVKVDARPFTIKQFSITFINLPMVGFKVVCTTRTYVCSLANDYGKALRVPETWVVFINEFKHEDFMTNQSYKKA